MTAPDTKVTSLKARRTAKLGDILRCKDRADGHDWDNLKWEDGPDLRRGRRIIYVTYRIGRCTRCASGRWEVFEQHRGMIVKAKNRYKLSDAYKSIGKMSQSQVHTALREASR